MSVIAFRSSILNQSVKMTKLNALVLATLVSHASFGLCQTVVNGSDRETTYSARFHMSGFLLRAAVVCPGQNWKLGIIYGLDLIASPELKVISQAYPKIVKQWAMEGADSFNTGVMKSGIVAACKFAETVRQQIEQQLKLEQQPDLVSPIDIVREALDPLLKQIPHGDKNETELFTQGLKAEYKKYASNKDNFRRFDADLLLGAQVWDGSNPDYKELVVNDEQNFVKLVLSSKREDGSASVSLTVIYSMRYELGVGWRIDDIVYDDRISLRSIISNALWCSSTNKSVPDIDSCTIEYWK